VLVLVLTPLLAGGWVWLRNSSFVAVRRVGVSGAHGPEAGRIAAVLQTRARSMSTLHVDLGALRAAVAPFAIVREVRARAEFPHGLRIEVIERPPVAALTVAGSRTAVAADGVVLGPALLSGSLPSLTAAYVPGAGQRVGNSSLLASLSVLGAAPAPLARLVKNVFTGPKGLTVAMRNGLLAYFGDATRPHAKWFSLARVLADSSSAGASYVDVRLAARPAAGFPAGVAPPATAASGSSATSEAPSPGESTVTALASSLTAGQPGSSKKSEEPAATPTTGSSSSSGSESTPSSSGESESEAATGVSSQTTGEASESAPVPGG
jgi:cell division protein FtsQ